MLKKLRVIIFAVLLVIIIVESSRAMVVPVIAIGAGALIAAGIYFGGLYVYMKPGGTASVKPNGDVSRPSGATWINLKGENPGVYDVDLNAVIPYDQIKSIANNDPSKYPSINSALNSTNDTSLTENNLPVGGKFNFGGKTYTIASSTTGFTTTPCNNIYPAPYANSGGALTCGSGSCDGQPCSKYTTYTFESPVPVVPKPRTASEFKEVISEDDGDLESAYKAEIDKMLQDPNYVPVFSDATTGLPWDPPPIDQIATPEQVKAHNDAHTAEESRSTASSSANTAASSAENAAIAAQTAATQAQNTVNANPGNSALQQQALDAAAAAARARAEADRARAEADRLKAELDKDQAEESEGEATTAPGQPGANNYEPLTEKPEKKELLSLLQNWAASSPLGSMVRSFVINTSSTISSVTIANIYGRNIEFDFARYESTFNICGGMLLIIVHGFAIIVVMKGW